MLNRWFNHGSVGFDNFFIWGFFLILLFQIINFLFLDTERQLFQSWSWNICLNYCLFLRDLHRLNVLKTDLAYSIALALKNMIILLAYNLASLSAQPTLKNRISEQIFNLI